MKQGKRKQKRQRGVSFLRFKKRQIRGKLDQGVRDKVAVIICPGSVLATVLCSFLSWQTDYRPSDYYQFGVSCCTSF